jgi:hypothetical protein
MGVVGTIQGSNDDDHALKAKALVNPTIRKVKSSLGTNLLEVNMTRDEIAQAYTYTQRHMNDAWSEMVSCSPCFAFYSFLYSLWFIQTIWDTLIPLWTSILAVF